MPYFTDKEIEIYQCAVSPTACMYQSKFFTIAFLWDVSDFSTIKLLNSRLNIHLYFERKVVI